MSNPVIDKGGNKFWYKEENWRTGGHYGLPHHITDMDLCPNCKDKIDIPEHSHSVPCNY